jgi:hypothetical protein
VNAEVSSVSIGFVSTYPSTVLATYEASLTGAITGDRATGSASREALRVAV